MGGKAGFPGQDGGRGGIAGVGGLSLDTMPRAIHASKSIRDGEEYVGPIGDYLEEKALGDVVA